MTKAKSSAATVVGVCVAITLTWVVSTLVYAQSAPDANARDSRNAYSLEERGGRVLLFNRTTGDTWLFHEPLPGFGEWRAVARRLHPDSPRVDTWWRLSTLKLSLIQHGVRTTVEPREEEDEVGGILLLSSFDPMHGLEAGDIIVRIGDMETPDLASVVRAVAARLRDRDTRVVTVGVVRGGQTIELSLRER
jgi:hypothetical protein